MDKNTAPLRKIKNSGQSLVEYIFLLAAIIFLIGLTFRNPYLLSFFGPDSSYFNKVKKSLEHSYRHAFEYSVATVINQTDDQRRNGTHESFVVSGQTHFFYVPLYPQ
ncbi:MAG: hypothetical protein HQK50_04285 [Oligoflexia bacterium]|nr:hypothetical protein [Oligoflexia bacterium]MBF0364763.1 hypothetical protein [Oligoflexia bacterium]